jgi:hypothetical protein
VCAGSTGEGVNGQMGYDEQYGRAGGSSASGQGWLDERAGPPDGGQRQGRQQ